MAGKRRQTSLSNWIMGGIGNAFGIMPSNEEDIGGVSPPRGIRIPGGVREPDSGKPLPPYTGPRRVWPSKPSKDTLKRRKQQKFIA